MGSNVDRHQLKIQNTPRSYLKDGKGEKVEYHLAGSRVPSFNHFQAVLIFSLSQLSTYSIYPFDHWTPYQIVHIGLLIIVDPTRVGDTRWFDFSLSTVE